MKKENLFCLFCFFIFSMTLHGQTVTDSSAFEDTPYWRQALGGAVICAPSSQAESVVVVSDGGNVKAFSWQGRPLWDYYARGRLQPFVTRSWEGTTYVCRSSSQSNGVLIAVNRSGRELWQINLGEPMTAPVMTGWDNRLFVFTPRQIRCFTASGQPLWAMPLEKNIALSPHKDGEGGFYLVTEDRDFMRISAFGRVISEKLDTIPLAIIPVKGESLTVQEDSLLFLYPNGTLQLQNTGHESRQTLRNISLPAQPHSMTALGDSAAILLKNGSICLISISGEQLLWTGDTHLSSRDFSGAALQTNFFYDERGIYLLTQNGAVGFTEDGHRLWIIELRNTVALPAFSDEGVLYSGGADWLLYAYRLEERVRTTARTMYGPAPEGNYGTGLPRPELWADNNSRFNEDDMNPRFREIEHALREGAVGEKEIEYASWLMEIAGSSLGIPAGNSLPGNPRPGFRPPVYVLHRAQAVRLLGVMGSRETIPFLANLFIRDNDTAIKAAAAEAIGRIGVDPEGIALRAFANAVFPPAQIRDEQVLSAIAAATGALCRFSGPPLSETGIRILTALTSYEMPPAARNMASRQLQSLLE